MNSSGIKRGLATTAVSALAVSGIPFIASSASAAPGDAISVVSVSPVRNGGTIGVDVQVKLTGTTAAELELANTALTAGGDGSADTAAQTIGDGVANAGDITVTPIANGSALDSNKTDGLAEAIVNVRVGTTNAGDNFAFALFGDDDNDDAVDGTEARVQVTGITSGAPTALAATPSLQSAPVGVDSADYTVTLRDSAGRTTQLTGTEVIEFDQVSGPVGGVATFDPAAGWNATQVGTDGIFPFSASGDTAGLYRLQAGAFTAAGAPNAFASTVVSLDVNGTTADAGTIAAGELNLVTGADTRAGFGQLSNNAQVRPDQNTITFEIDDNGPVSQAGRVVTLTATGAGVTFGGQGTQTQTVTLDQDGKGSVTFTADAASVQSGDSITVSGAALANPFVVNYAAPTVGNATVDADATTYLSSFGGTVNPVFTVRDQYGNPVQGLFVSYELDGGANDTNTQSARVVTDANGRATFAITDTRATATNRGTDTIIFRVFDGSLSNNLLATDSGSQIVYSADGQGADFLLTVDGQTPGSAAYNPSVVPLTDAVADSGAETGTLLVAGGTPGAAATVTVDGGALILGDTNTLEDATASKTGLVGDTYQIVGTTEGVVNVTVTSGGKTQTATLTVAAPANNAGTARNIELEGPEGAVAGDVVEFTATITDAFGNPVTGFDDNNIDARITGSGNEQGTSGDSDVNGEITYLVEITEGASNPVTLRLEASGAQFGAGEDELTDAVNPVAAPGLTASEDVASATVEVVNLEELEQAVADAEQDLADAEAALASANADLDVAQTELAVAQANVDALKERRADLRQKLNKAKRNDNKQKAKTTRKKLRAVKRDLRAANDTVTIATAKVAAEQVSVDAAQDAVDTAEENLAQAQADLDEAQN